MKIFQNFLVFRLTLNGVIPLEKSADKNLNNKYIPRVGLKVQKEQMTSNATERKAMNR